MISPRRRGFSLIEVMIAVAILAISLTSLLSAQLMAMRATRYARSVVSSAFLAESKLLDIEWEMKRDGWGSFDREFDGDFSDEGWPDIRYKCLVDYIELPEYSAMQRLADENAEDTDGSLRQRTGVADAGDQAFGSLGMVWSLVKAAIENSLRKASCTVTWKDGTLEHDFQLMTFWTDPARLDALPQPGEEPTPGDQSGDNGSGSPSTPSGGQGPGGRQGGGRGGQGGGRGGGAGGMPPGGMKR